MTVMILWCVCMSFPFLRGFTVGTLSTERKRDCFFVPTCQPCDELLTFPGCTLPLASVSWGRLQPPCDPAKYQQ